MKSRKSITRLDFLKRSGMAAGLLSLPQSILAAAQDSAANDEVSVRKLAGYQIVVPDEANLIEQQSAEKLQHYISELSHTNLAITKEKDYRSGPAFFLGQTRIAKTQRID